MKIAELKKKQKRKKSKFEKDRPFTCQIYPKPQKFY